LDLSQERTFKAPGVHPGALFVVSELLPLAHFR
jgi:hypothetical protein